jgi:uncharacterized protein (UPF0548 family)
MGSDMKNYNIRHKNNLPVPQLSSRLKNMVAVMLLIGMMLPITQAEALAQDILWTRQFGTSTEDRAYSVTVDSTGIYVAGGTYGELSDQTSAGLMDAFIRKYDINGTELWTRQFGTSGEDQAWAVTTDDSGIYVAGYTSGALPGQIYLGYADAFIRKYDANGAVVWTSQFGSGDYDRAYAIFADSTGIYVAGRTVNAGFCEAYVCKYNADGEVEWTRQFGTADHDLALAVTADSLGGIYVAGYTEGTLPGQTNNLGYADIYVRKYNIDGTELWTRQFGTLYDDVANAVTADASGIYVAGYTYGTLPEQSSAGSADAFIRKYDANGAVVWTSQFGTWTNDAADAVTADSTGIYVAGGTYGELSDQTSAGLMDAFIRKYDTNGTELWTRQFGTSLEDRAFGVTTNSSSIYVAGWTYGTLSYETSAGGIDAFVSRFSEANTAPLADDDSAFWGLMIPVITNHAKQP